MFRFFCAIYILALSARGGIFSQKNSFLFSFVFCKPRKVTRLSLRESADTPRRQQIFRNRNLILPTRNIQKFITSSDESDSSLFFTSDVFHFAHAISLMLIIDGFGLGRRGRMAQWSVLAALRSGERVRKSAIFYDCCDCARLTGQMVIFKL